MLSLADVATVILTLPPHKRGMLGWKLRRLQDEHERIEVEILLHLIYRRGVEMQFVYDRCRNMYSKRSRIPEGLVMVLRHV